MSRLKLILVAVGVILYSCKKENNNLNHYQTRHCCIERKVFDFERLTRSSDPNFTQFLKPIDSVNQVIKNENLSPRRADHPNGYWQREIWTCKGHILKIKLVQDLNERIYHHYYYILDQCYWMYQKEKYHTIKTDSLMQNQIYLFRKGIALESFS